MLWLSSSISLSLSNEVALWLHADSGLPMSCFLSYFQPNKKHRGSPLGAGCNSCVPMRVSACSQTATSMPQILLEVTVKATHLLTRVSACIQKGYFHIMLLIIQQHIGTQPSQPAGKGVFPYCWKWQLNDSLVDESLSMPTYSAGSDSDSKNNSFDESLSMQTSMLLILMEVTVKATHRLTRFSAACSQRATSGLLSPGCDSCVQIC